MIYPREHRFALWVLSIFTQHRDILIAGTLFTQHGRVLISRSFLIWHGRFAHLGSFHTAQPSFDVWAPFHGWFALCTSGSVSHNTAGLDIGIPFHTSRPGSIFGSVSHHKDVAPSSLSLSLSLCARGLPLCVCVPLVRMRENKLRCGFLAILHASLWYLVGGLGLHGLLLICCYTFRFESLRSLGACQIPENNPRLSSILLQHRRSKSSTSSSKGFFLCLRLEREREREKRQLWKTPVFAASFLPFWKVGWGGT
jgi:hypothetical protein